MLVGQIVTLPSLNNSLFCVSASLH